MRMAGNMADIFGVLLLFQMSAYLLSFLVGMKVFLLQLQTEKSFHENPLSLTIWEPM